MYTKKSEQGKFTKDTESSILKISGRNYKFKVYHFSTTRVALDKENKSDLTLYVKHRYFVPDILLQPTTMPYKFVSMVTPLSEIPVPWQERITKEENFKLGFEGELEFELIQNSPTISFTVEPNQMNRENIHMLGNQAPHFINLSMIERIKSLEEKKTFSVVLKNTSSVGLLDHGIYTDCMLTHNGETRYIDVFEIVWVDNANGEGNDVSYNINAEYL